MEYSIGTDLGGTRIKFVIIDVHGRVIDRQALSITDDAASWSGKIKELVHSTIKQRQQPRCIGLAAPGLSANDYRSIAFMPGRLQGLEGLDWTDFVDCGTPISVLNDAHAALFGEYWQGAAAGLKHAFLLTLGTGVGGAVLANGKMMMGTIGRFGHLGHISLDSEGERDSTLTPGSLEDCIGDETISKRSAGHYTTTKELIEDVKRNDPQACDIWLKSIEKLACGISSLINVLDPEAVILGGGIIQAGKMLFEPLDKALEKYEWRPGGHRVQILPAKLGDYAGAIGAVRFALNQNVNNGRLVENEEA